MNRVRDSTFFLITVLAAVFLLGGYFLLEDKNHLVETTQKELKGLSLQRDILGIIIAMQKVRGSHAPLAAKDQKFLPISEQNKQTLKELFAKIDAQNAVRGLLPVDEWNELKKSGEDLFLNETLPPSSHLFEERTTLIKRFIRAMRDISDNSTLILGPEITSYYLIDITTNLLPRMIEYIAHHRGAITAMLLKKQPINPDKIHSDLLQLEPLYDNLIRAASMVQRSKTTDQIYGPNVTDISNADIFYKSLLDSALHRSSTVSAYDFFMRGTEVIRAYLATYDQSADLLNLLLKQRIKINKDGRVSIIFFLLFLYCFVIAIGYLALKNYVQKQEVIAARDLKHVLGKLEKTNDELEHFAYVASHDLKEPLRTVASFARLLQHKYGDTIDATGKEYLTILMNASMRMQQMVSNLLDYAKLDYELSKPESLDCAEELTLVLESLKQPIEQSGAVITTSALPTITHHGAQFMRLMQNLISNAIKYSREGTAPQIHIACEERPDAWLFSVKDNGIGIDKKYFRKIFEPFKRLHNQDQYEGTGIGLAMCKKMVERMGGKLWLSSTPNEGSVFYFTLAKQLN